MNTLANGFTNAMKHVGNGLRMTAPFILLLGVPFVSFFNSQISYANSTENSRLENSLIDEALSSQSLEKEPNPNGKVIERIAYVPFDVILKGDPVPQFINIFHTITKPAFLANELTFVEGEPWDQSKIDESERNLRSREYLLSSVRIEAAKGKTENEVVAIVVTRDLWSIRTAFDFTYADSKLQNFELEFVETNLAGRMMTLGPTLKLDLSRMGLGQVFRAPNLIARKVTIRQEGLVYVNRSSGQSEGYKAGLEISKPIFSREVAYGWSLHTSREVSVERTFRGGNQTLVQFASGTIAPYEYRKNSATIGASLTRAMGLNVRHVVELGWDGQSNLYSLPKSYGIYSTPDIENFNNTIQKNNEQAGIIHLAYKTYLYSFQKLIDIDTFAITEEFHLGPLMSSNFNLANPIFGFSARFFEPSVSFDYSLFEHDDLLTVSAAGAIRNQSGAVPDTSWINRKLVFEIKNVSPKAPGSLLGRFLGLRLHSHLKHVRRFDYRALVSDYYGGSDSLRGFPSDSVGGPQSLVINQELRTRPVELFNTYFGFATFFDMADGWFIGEPIAPSYSIGGGMRILFPQFNREVIRIDVGIPLNLQSGQSGSNIVVKFDQAF